MMDSVAVEDLLLDAAARADVVRFQGLLEDAELLERPLKLNVPVSPGSLEGRTLLQYIVSRTVSAADSRFSPQRAMLLLLLDTDHCPKCLANLGLNVPDYHGNTALMLAILYRDPVMVAMLANTGRCNLSAKNLAGDTALSLAVKAGDFLPEETTEAGFPGCLIALLTCPEELSVSECQVSTLLYHNSEAPRQGFMGAVEFCEHERHYLPQKYLVTVAWLRRYQRDPDGTRRLARAQQPWTHLFPDHGLVDDVDFVYEDFHGPRWCVVQ